MLLRMPQGGSDEAAHQTLPGHVGARDEPSQRCCDHAGEEPDASRHRQRDEEGPANGGVGEQAGEIGQGERARLVGESIVAQPEQRQQNQHAQHDRKQHEQRRRQIESTETPPECGIGGHCCNGHLVTCELDLKWSDYPAAASLFGSGTKNRRIFHWPDIIQVPKYSSYFCLISSIESRTAAGSELSSLICDNGVRLDFSFTSGRTERRPPKSSFNCCASCENMKE